MIVNPVLYQQGVKLPELTNPGAAADLLAGKQLVDQFGEPLTGTMPTATHPKPTLSRSGGTVTAQHVQSAGYTDGGTTTETLTIPTKAGTTITPGTSRKTAVSSGYLTTGAVYVAGDTNLKAENIKSGVSIFGVAGSCKSVPQILYLTKDMFSIRSDGIYVNTGLTGHTLFSIAVSLIIVDVGIFVLCGPCNQSNDGFIATFVLRQSSGTTPISNTIQTEIKLYNGTITGNLVGASGSVVYL